MEIGTLNQRITFLENRVVTDEIGNHTAVWDEVFSCWAKVTLKASAEHTDAGVTKETQALEFLIRQSSKLDAVCNRQPNLVSGCHIQHHQCYTGLSAQRLSETCCRSQKGRTK